MGFLAVAPLYKATYDLSNGNLITPGIETEKKVFHFEKAKAVSLAYANLLSASEQLSEAIHHSEGIADKDLEKFAKEVTALAKNWNK